VAPTEVVMVVAELARAVGARAVVVVRQGKVAEERAMVEAEMAMEAAAMALVEAAMAAVVQVAVAMAAKKADATGLVMVVAVQAVMETVGHWEESVAAAVAYTPTAQPMSENVGYYPRPSGAR
jgi:hypothetical protein